MQKMINTKCLLKDLRNYKPTSADKIRERKETLTNAEMLYNSRNNIIKAFEDGVFPFKDEPQKEKWDRSDKALRNW